MCTSNPMKLYQSCGKYLLSRGIVKQLEIHQQHAPRPTSRALSEVRPAQDKRGCLRGLPRGLQTHYSALCGSHEWHGALRMSPFADWETHTCTHYARSVHACSGIGASSSGSVSPMDVLDFWFGEGKWGTPAMADTKSFKAMNPLWWGTSADYSPLTAEQKAAVDERCRSRFADAVRQLRSGGMADDPAWRSPAGLYATMLLADQLSRNCFRGTDEAFAADEVGMAAVRDIFSQQLHRTYEPVLFLFLATPGQHSEDIDDHKMNMELLEFMKGKFGPDAGFVRSIESHIMEHKAIMDRFGRYPHRNRALRRASSPRELAWLADYNNLPAFAKSQLPRPKAD